MYKQGRQLKFSELRKLYPFFIFESYSITYTETTIKVQFHFHLGNKHHFRPSIKIPINQKHASQGLSGTDIRNLVFNIGMVELLSYWKCTCSPNIIIKPHALQASQIAWWKKLYFKGLGEFFYLNGIETDSESFVSIESASADFLSKQNFSIKQSTLIPVGGGKDSIVTLEILRASPQKIAGLILNSHPSREQTLQIAGIEPDNIIVIEREIDPVLLKLNEAGFLNGHTPFSALLAFVSLLTAAIYGHKHIALSNESSANEATVLHTHINHQYSKSLEFENDFRKYVAEYITPDLNYFSFLRPLNELQIARLFAKFPKYFPVFRSCNAGSKSNIWCGKCAKCLFVYIILSPFVSAAQLQQIFSGDLLDDINLKSVFNQLSGIEAVKPFECVGTLDDVNMALQGLIRNNNTKDLPELLKYYINTEVYASYTEADFAKYLQDLDVQHNLSPSFFQLLNTHLQ